MVRAINVSALLLYKKTAQKNPLEIEPKSKIFRKVGPATMILLGGVGDKYNLLDDVTEFFNVGEPQDQVTKK